MSSRCTTQTDDFLTVKQGYTIRWAELERPIGGFRRAGLHVTDETGNDVTLTWLQPWRGNRIDE